MIYYFYDLLHRDIYFITLSHLEASSYGYEKYLSLWIYSFLSAQLILIGELLRARGLRHGVKW